MNSTKEYIISILPADFAKESKVWIYQSAQPFTEAQRTELDAQLETFANTWQSHGAKVKGWGKTILNHFIVLMADEAATGVSGCSTDSSVRLIKSFEQQFGLQLFDRMQVALIENDEIQTSALTNLQINTAKENIFYFDNLVATKQELSTEWMKSIQDGWLGKKLQKQVA